MENSVELLGFYGGDETHALSAWTSTSRDLTEEKRERMGKLLTMLAENGHHTPFEKSSLHFLVTTDMASHIHLIKHRIGVSINAESARYRELRDDRAYTPIDWPTRLTEHFEGRVKQAQADYHWYVSELIKEGFTRSRAKESARFILPYANQLTSDVMFNFRSFMHFQGLRNDIRAQKEIHDIAEEMLRLVRLTHAFDLSLRGFGYSTIQS